MDKKMIGIIATVATVLCCACPGFFMCIFGVVGLTGTPVQTELNGVESSAPMAMPVALALVCASFILILIPFVVGFFTLRSKPNPVAAVPFSGTDQIPPAS